MADNLLWVLCKIFQKIILCTWLENIVHEDKKIKPFKVKLFVKKLYVW